ncbi:MAG: 3-phosphoshikimate 1-carboxyvinyltransferase [Firmicutes bacterium]|nr:3-phosphoshikimate 1-carboxyvinyltransferase [Bacillota bacterium]
MDLKVYPAKLKGTVKAPPSKSMAHRALICAALAEGESIIHGISDSKDMEATIGCMKAIGADIVRCEDENDVRIRGIFSDGINVGKTAGTSGRRILDCIESGSTLRFILPVAAALGVSADFTGTGKLPERPMTPLADEMKKKGVTFLPDDRDLLPFTIEGKLQPGVYDILGNISSQYISGLIFALPLLEGDSRINIIGGLESAGYVNLTLQMVKDFGITIEKTDSGFFIPGSQKYKARECEVEGDYSNAAFWLVAAACGSELDVTGLREDSAQGDRKAADILKRAGAGSVMKGIDVDCRDIPDIVPILSVGACAAQGVTRFLDAGRLRIKESDRLAAMADCLSRLGAKVEERKDELIVYGGETGKGSPNTLKGGCEVSGYNDHRIVMSMAIAALICREPVIIKGAEAVAKSYPNFFEEYRRLGGIADVITDR